ncbi:hypothetical protein AB0F91_39840 [Amycolatopsis sp. NPDC023774]|uniref:hypothetical protein n=1 Tax=Amycolatopsis sp. NPDC023774 TaxID=3155015 RepID=UPI0033E697C9
MITTTAAAAERPDPPSVDNLNIPFELIQLHHILIDVATHQARIESNLKVADDWRRAAKAVARLSQEYRARMDGATPKQLSAMRVAGTQAVDALIEALRHAGEWQKSGSWFDIAAGWIDDVRLQASDQPCQ